MPFFNGSIEPERFTGEKLYGSCSRAGVGSKACVGERGAMCSGRSQTGERLKLYNFESRMVGTIRRPVMKRACVSMKRKRRHSRRDEWLIAEVLNRIIQMARKK